MSLLSSVIVSLDVSSDCSAVCTPFNGLRSGKDCLWRCLGVFRHDVVVLCPVLGHLKLIQTTGRPLWFFGRFVCL